jgi:phosphate transport system substrate-binding protein
MVVLTVDQTSGAGATFPNPLYQNGLVNTRNSSNVQIDYQSIGSGGGIKQIKEQTVDFGASDSPMKDEDLKSALEYCIPTVLGAVVITYNLAGVSAVTAPEFVTDIFLGTQRLRPTIQE